MPAPCFCLDASKCLLCQRDFGAIADRLREHFIPCKAEHKRGNGRVAPAQFRGRNVDSAPVQPERTLERSSRAAPRGLS